MGQMSVCIEIDRRFPKLAPWCALCTPQKNQMSLKSCQNVSWSIIKISWICTRSVLTLSLAHLKSPYPIFVYRTPSRCLPRHMASEGYRGIFLVLADCLGWTLESFLVKNIAYIGETLALPPLQILDNNWFFRTDAGWFTFSGEHRESARSRTGSMNYPLIGPEVGSGQSTLYASLSEYVNKNSEQ